MDRNPRRDRSSFARRKLPPPPVQAAPRTQCAARRSTATVEFGRGNSPERGTVIARSADGLRAIGLVSQPADLTAMIADHPIGQRVDIDVVGSIHFT
jgi:hypothetical protein